MRLIDADALIEKFDEKVDMKERLIDARTAERFATFCALADAVKEMPTVDAVPIIRCKDCKYRYWDDWLEEYFCQCYAEYMQVLPDDFCSNAERKEENDEQLD